MTTLEINEFTNSELEEMGIRIPCACLSTYINHDDHDDAYAVCIDCGDSTLVRRSVRTFPW